MTQQHHKQSRQQGGREPARRQTQGGSSEFSRGGTSSHQRGGDWGNGPSQQDLRNPYGSNYGHEQFGRNDRWANPGREDYDDSLRHEHHGGSEPGYFSQQDPGNHGRYGDETSYRAHDEGRPNPYSARHPSTLQGYGDMAYGRSGPDQGGSRQHSEFDPDYLQWREQQLRSLDDDYRSWREDRFKKFSDDFSTWRGQRTDPSSSVVDAQPNAGKSEIGTGKTSK